MAQSAMAYLLLYQALPLALLWFLLERLCRSPARARWALALIFAAGTVAQFILWARSSPDLENPDSQGFWRIGHGLETDLRGLLYRPKLYPLFLGFFQAPKAAAFAQCILKLGMAGWIARAGRALAWRPAATAFVLALFLFDNLWLREPLKIFDTTLFAFLFLGAMVLALETILHPSPARFPSGSARFVAFCGMAGFASLCRQVADPCLLVAGAASFARVLSVRSQRRVGPVLSSAAAAAAGLCLAASGAFVNGLTHGAYLRSVALGVNVYTHYAYYELNDPAAPEWDFVAARLPGIREELPAWRTGWRYDMPWPVNAMPHRLERKLGSADVTEIRAADALLTARALAGMQGKPARYLGAFGNEAARLLCKCEGDYPVALIARGDAARRLERGLTHLPLWLLAMAGCIGCTLGRGRRLALALPLACGVGYLALIAAIQIGLCRYGLPAWPVLLVPAGEAFTWLANGPTPDRRAAASPGESRRSWGDDENPPQGREEQGRA
jgi:hypothetical protein